MAEHEVPEGVERLLEILVGNDWPEGNEGDLRSMAGAWRGLATALSGSVGGAVEAAVQSADSGLGGPSREAFDTFLASVTGPSGYITGLAETAQALAQACDDMALEIETLRTLIIESLILLALQIAADLAAAAFTMGASTLAIEPQMIATRTVIIGFIRSAMIRLTSHLVESVANQVVMTFIAQLIERAQHRRSGFDVGQIALAAKNGAIGGAVGFGMGNLGGLAKSGLGKLGAHIPLPDAVGHVAAAIPKPVRAVAIGAGNTVVTAAWGAASGTAEAAAQDAAAGSFGDEISGSENGAFSGAFSRFHGAANPGDRFPVTIGGPLNKAVNSLAAPKDGGAGRGTGTGPPRTPGAGIELPELNLPAPDDWGTWPDDFPAPTDHTPPTTPLQPPTPALTNQPASHNPPPTLDPLPPEDWSGWADSVFDAYHQETG